MPNKIDYIISIATLIFVVTILIYKLVVFFLDKVQELRKNNIKALDFIIELQRKVTKLEIEVEFLKRYNHELIADYSKKKDDHN